MGQEYSWEVRGRAKELYTVDGLTYEQVAAELAELFPPPVPSRTQIQRWAADEGWRDRKRQLRRDLLEIQEGSLEFRKRLLNKSLEILRGLDEGNEKLDSQKMFGLARVARVVIPPEPARREEAAAPEIDRPALFLEALEFVAQVLKEIDPEGLKILARNFEVIVSRFKASHAQTA